MTTVDTLLKRKGNEIWSISPQASVFEALQQMAEKDSGALLVIDEGKLVGIFTERDYARKLVLKGKFSRDTNVGELMTSNVLYMEPSNTVNDCMALMTSRRIRHLPVMDGGVLIGIVTIGDIVKQVISEQKHAIAELEKYIAGSY